MLLLLQYPRFCINRRLAFFPSLQATCPRKAGGMCVAQGIEILASSGCSWAPFGRILVPKSCQHGPQGIPRRLQEWIFGGFSMDFNADFTYLYQQVSKYERHWATAQDTVCLARGPRRKTHYVLHESRGLLGRWAC